MSESKLSLAYLAGAAWRAAGKPRPSPGMCDHILREAGLNQEARREVLRGFDEKPNIKVKRKRK